MNKFLKIFLYLFCSICLFCSFFSTALAVTCNEKYLNSTGKCASDCASLGANFVIDSTTGLCTSPDVCCHEVANTTGTASSLELQVPLFDYAKAANLPEYIVTIYKYAVIVIIPLAVMMIIIGGVLWISAAGNPGSIKKAQKYIFDALIGLAIAFLSYTLFSLVGITNIKMAEVQSIERIEGGDLIIINGQTYTQEAGNALLPAGRKGSADSFQTMPCPTKANPTFQVYFTNYYTPAYGDKAAYASFGCNLGMQCSCPKGNTGSKTCVAGSYSWAPCKDFSSSLQPGRDYCNHTASGKPPVANYTIAADIPRSGRSNACFKLGCKLSIEGKGTFEITDTGSTRKIIGLHMDYYSGVGRTGNPPAGVYQVTVLNPESCLR